MNSQQWREKKDRGSITLLRNYGYCRALHKQNQNKNFVKQTAAESATIT